MYMDVKVTIKYLILCLALVVAASCKKDPVEPNPQPEQIKRVFLLYADGYNNLTSYMRSDVTELAKDSPMGDVRNECAVLVYEHFTAGYLDYNTPKSPLLVELHRKLDGTMVRDTLITYPATDNSASAECVRKVLEDVRSRYPNASVGMCFSGHGTGYLPEEYYSDKVTEDDPFIFTCSSAAGRRELSQEHDGRVIDFSQNPFLFGDPLVKSIGCQAYKHEGTLHTHEIEIPQFADAIPYKLDYLIMDACLMGGVEVLYELRESTDYIVSSCMEIYASGLYYEEMLDKVLYRSTPNLEGVCKDYIEHSSSATVSLTYTRGIGEVASVCRTLFGKYASAMEMVNENDVQKYYRGSSKGDRYWFFDMVDILVKSGITAEELERLQSAMDKCVIYKDATRTAIGGYPIVTHCGMSMFLPKLGDTDLKEYYLGLAWNRATGLVR